MPRKKFDLAEKEHLSHGSGLIKFIKNSGGVIPLHQATTVCPYAIVEQLVSLEKIKVFRNPNMGNFLVTIV